MKKFRPAILFVLMMLVSIALTQQIGVHADEAVSAVTTIGDVDNSGKIDAKDVTQLRRFLAGGWGVTLDDEEADLDRSGKVDAKDVTMLRRFLAGGWGVALPQKYSSEDIAIDKVNFPDDCFREYILEEIDEDEDGILSKSEASVAKIDCSGWDIENLTGIGYFSELTELKCGDNLLEELDLSRNPKLKIVNLLDGKLRSINVSGNPELERLNVECNFLTELDVSNNPKLSILACTENELKTLQLENNVNLTILECSDNLLEELDLSNNLDLVTLVCSYNGLKRLKLEKNSNLTILKCDDNQLEELNLSNNLGLGTLYCTDNLIESLDLREHPYLTELNCDDDVSVLRNIYICPYNFYDDVFREYIKIFDKDKDDYLSTEEIEAVTDIDVSGKEIYDLAGITTFRTLDSLNCSNTRINYLNLEGVKCSRLIATNMPDFTHLDVDCIGLTELDVSYSGINFINCGYNQLTSLDVSTLENLSTLYCWDNELSELDITNNPYISTVNCSRNKLTSLKLGYVKEYGSRFINCTDNNIEKIDLTNSNITKDEIRCDEGVVFVDDFVPVEINADNFPDDNFRMVVLEKIDGDKDGKLSRAELRVNSLYCYGRNISSMKGLEFFTELQWLNCTHNKLESLDTSMNKNLISLLCGDNQISKLDLSENTALTDLTCCDNNLTELDLLSNRNLTYLDFGSNELTSIDLSNNPCLDLVSFWNNNISEIDLSNCPKLRRIDCGGNKIKKLDFSNNTMVDTINCDSDVELIWKYEISEATFPNDVFRNYVKQFDDDGNGFFSIEEIEKVRNIDVSGTDVGSLSGIIVFGELDSLNCSNTKIKNLNICGEETNFSIKYLDASNNDEMESADCSNLRLETIKISGQKLKQLDIFENHLTSLDLSGCPALEGLDCYDNMFESLDVSACPLLEKLDCTINRLTTLDLSNNPNLTEENLAADSNVDIIWE